MAQRVGRGIALLFHDRGTRRGEWSAARPGRTLSPGKTRYPFYRRLGGPQGRSGRAENLVHTGLRSRTVQPVAQSLYRLSYRAHMNFNYIPIIREKILGICIQMTTTKSTARFAHRFKSHGYCIYWREYVANFII